jgi:hypothetical protein
MVIDDAILIWKDVSMDEYFQYCYNHSNYPEAMLLRVHSLALKLYLTELPVALLSH